MIKQRYSGARGPFRLVLQYAVFPGSLEEHLQIKFSVQKAILLVVWTGIMDMITWVEDHIVEHLSTLHGKPERSCNHAPLC